MAVDLGKIGQTPKGEFDDTKTYEKLDVVSFQGSSYVSIINDNNFFVGNTSAWQINAEKGNQGSIGDPGPPGDLSIINFGIDNSMHLQMQLETNTNLDFTVDNKGHLILIN